MLAILGLIVVAMGLIAVLAPQVTSQAQELVDRASDGLSSLQTWVAGPPFNLGPDALGGLLDKGVKELQNNSQQIAGVVIGSLGAIGSAVVTFVLALVLCFFFLKDGPRFLPWLQTWIGSRTGAHIEVVADRVWTALGQYVWSQAAVALVDGVFIGLGVWLLGVPFALPIAVLAIVLVVQQLEGNVMQPILVGRTLKIHAAVVLTSVALGGTLFGIVGAFLAVPAVAAFQVITRYIREQLEKPPTAPSAVITDLSPAQEKHSPVNE